MAVRAIADLESMSVESKPAPHTPVLVARVVEFLAPAPGQVIVDCTVGAGGHSLAILPKILPATDAGGAKAGRVLAVDRDAQALAAARERLIEFAPQVEFLHDNFSQLPELLTRAGVDRIHGIVADFGLSSLHVDQPERGFSFLREGPLDMRMDQRQPLTAASLIRQAPEEELARILEVYGEERFARRIAKRLVAARRTAPIQTTTQLARVVADAVPGRGASFRIHPATRTFQALRIAVNQELAAVEALLRALPDVLLPGGRAVLISFHSLEDRLVKRAFQQGARDGLFRMLTKKPVTASDQELAANPRSRSAKLRAVERLA